jgi:hypothetical protein
VRRRLIEAAGGMVGGVVGDVVVRAIIGFLARCLREIDKFQL